MHKLKRQVGKSANSERGSVLALLLVVSVVICVVGYVVSGLIGSVMTSLGDEDLELEAQMLAGDLREYTKYLLSYEKVAFVDMPHLMDGNRPALLREMWGQGFAFYDMEKPTNMMNVCGGYTADATFIGNLMLGSNRVFCPFYIRQSDYVGRVLEDMLLDRWAPKSGGQAFILSGNAPQGTTMADVFMKTTSEKSGIELPEGWYRFAFDYSKRGSEDPDWFRRPDSTIPFYLGQRIFDLALDSSINLKVSAKVYVDIYTDSMGFSGQMTERFYKITSKITINRNGSTKDFFESENFILRVPTIKDFALFMAYPEDSLGVRTDSFKASMQINSGSTINGRVFFNGDIDTDYANLPTFLEPVFITGRLTTKDLTDPSKVGLFRQKFRRGLVTNVSASRYFFDGSCPIGSKTPEMVNGTGLKCRYISGKPPEAKKYDMGAYLDNIATGGCQCHPATINNDGTLTFNPQTVPGKPCESSVNGELNGKCNGGGTKNDMVRTLSVGARELTVFANYAHIVAPVKNMQLKASNTHIYGVVVGGYISSAAPATFVALTALGSGVGLPGLGSAATLAERNKEANMIGEGVSAPLPNFPLIQSSKDGFK